MERIDQMMAEATAPGSTALTRGRVALKRIAPGW
jgi:hypothetical protein